MSNIGQSLDELMDVYGVLGCCVVDTNTGMMLGSAGGGPVDLELASAHNTEVIRAKRRTMRALELTTNIEDIIVTLGDQFHLIRPVSSNSALFLYLVLDRDKGVLAIARLKLAEIEKALTL